MLSSRLQEKIPEFKKTQAVDFIIEFKGEPLVRVRTLVILKLIFRNKSSRMYKFNFIKK
jgi:hypothetical protein